MSVTEPHEKFSLFARTQRILTLHFAWIAFFIAFMLWFNHAPFEKSMLAALGLTKAEWNTLLLLNVTLTIPARIIIGIVVDKYGPRLVFTALLALGSIPCFIWALSSTFEQLAIARFLMGFIGASFVIGIRLISEWFPAKQVGLAQGIYGGWGNFGAAAAAVLLPTIAYFFDDAHGWRYATGMSGLIALVYSIIYYRKVRNTPKGSTYFKPKKSGAMEVTSKGDFIFYIIMMLPLYLVLALITWMLSVSGAQTLAAYGKKMTPLLADGVAVGIYISLAAIFIVNLVRFYQVNIEHLRNRVPEMHRYKFKQVAILNLAYMVAFGSELAVVSMLPGYFQKTFGLSTLVGSLIAAVFPFMNLIARPWGGFISDKVGRRNSLLILIGGLACGFLAMASINEHWPLIFVIMAAIVCSSFVQSACGATIAMASLIKRRLTGQIAGMIGAYGNLGATVFLMALLLTSEVTFFFIISATAVLVLLALLLLDEPKGSMAEIMPDGTVQMIKVD